MNRSLRFALKTMVLTGIVLAAPGARAEEFTIQIGATVGEGVPGVGAGRIENVASTDVYRFDGLAGQNLFFEEAEVAPAFGGYLRWQLQTPGGQVAFNGYFSGNNAVGRFTLPEAGAYVLTFYVSDPAASRIGAYSFRLRPIPADPSFAIHIGEVVADGQPAGAGNIEVPGARDRYTFFGVAGQNVSFEERAVAPAFGGYLRWRLTTPGGQEIFNQYFDGLNRLGRQILPETGTYALTFNVDANVVSFVGTYSFRLSSQVLARGDSLATPPGTALAVPFAVFLCNDVCEAGDIMSVSLLGGNSAHGGTVSQTATELVYTPKPGFLGDDTFTYLLQGQSGGQDVATVKVTVLPQADQYPVVVSLFPIGNSTTEVCLFDKVGPTCVIEASPEFKHWTRIATNAIDGNGLAHFEFGPAKTGMKFFRFRRP